MYHSTVKFQTSREYAAKYDNIRFRFQDITNTHYANTGELHVQFPKYSEMPSAHY
jgi:hypothetical protein